MTTTQCTTRRCLDADSKSGCESTRNERRRIATTTTTTTTRTTTTTTTKKRRKEEEEEESSAAAAFDFKTCPQSFVRERIYLENLRRVERHNEALERGWPTETKLELSADNPFADLTTREYETLMGETGMKKPESPGAETSSREKNEDDENVVATKELKKMTVGSYAFASLGGGSSSSKTIPLMMMMRRMTRTNDNDTSAKGVFGKVVVEQDENDREEKFSLRIIIIIITIMVKSPSPR